MKKCLIDYVKRGAFDELYTPEYAVYPVLDAIFFANTVIWCPFDTENSNIVKVLQSKGLKVIHSHISEGKNFFQYEPDEHYDMIISNPPYSIKDQVLERCYQLRKPFALLLPITALEGTKRGKLFRDMGLDLIVLDKRVDFNGKGKCWFNTSWFCWGTPIEGIQFATIDK